MATTVIGDTLIVALIILMVLAVGAALWGLARDTFRWLRALIACADQDLPDAGEDDTTFDLAA